MFCKQTAHFSGRVVSDGSGGGGVVVSVNFAFNEVADEELCEIAGGCRCWLGAFVAEAKTLFVPAKRCFRFRYIFVFAADCRAVE